jgi:C-terminal processing protease CtpA/Prc
LKPAAKVLFALGFWLVTAASQALPDAARTERLAELGKLWASVKYFHPFLAYKDVHWDAALLAALPKAAAARNAEEYTRAVESMLSVLEDPATGVVRRIAPAARPPAGVSQVLDGVLVVTIRPETAPLVRAAGAAIAAAKGVVFDLRHHEAWGGQDSESAGLVFISAGLNSRLAFGSLKAPGHRSRIHSGLASPWNGGSAFYHSAFYVRDGAVIEGSAGTPQKPVVFLIDGSSSLPPIAPALQATGKAWIVSEGNPSDASLVDKSLIDLPQGVRVQVRLSELVYEDGTSGLVPNLVVPPPPGQGPSDPALEAALAIAHNPGAAPAVSRPRIPAYGIPRREEAYAESEYPSHDLRLMAAFRIWAAFHYFFAYRDLMGEDWDKILHDSLPKLEQAADTREYALSLAEMVAHAHDSHVSISNSRAFNQYLGLAGPPVATRMIEGQPVVTALAPEAGPAVAPGDVVLRVDGEAAGERMERLKRYIAASTPQSLDRRVMQFWLNGEPGTDVTLTLRDRGNSVRDVRLRRARDAWRGRERACEVVQVLPGDIGYVDLDGLLPEGVDAMFEKLKNTRAIIFDMRGYPRGTAWLIAPRLTDRKNVAAARFRRPLALAPEGMWGDVATLDAGWDFLQYLPESDNWKYRGRTVMLIDERTISQAEHAGLFLEAANGTKFVGSRSAGADGDVTNITVPGGIVVSFSGQGVLHADGRQLQRVGLIPDIEVKPTIAGIRAGRDEVLERAFEYLVGAGHARPLRNVGEAR